MIRYYEIPSYTMKCRLYLNKEQKKIIDDAIYAKISDIDEFLSVLLRILKEQIKPMVSVDIDGVNTWFLPGGSICEK